MLSTCKLFCLLVIWINVCSGRFPNVYKTFKNAVQQKWCDDKKYADEPLILTPLIRDGRYQEAQNLSAVYLKDFEQLKSYSGYFTVNEKFKSNLFFWFFPSEENFSDAPVILWLQGGPGASSIGGLFEENGPLEFINQNTVPTRRKFSWTRSHSVIYIDNPVGTGYSFTDAEGFSTNESQVGENLYNALQQFFSMFPDLQRNEFFITGESYAGKYVPAVSYAILKRNPVADLKINLKGMCIGNGLSDPENQLIYSAYLFQLGLIDLNTKKTFEEYESRGVYYMRNERWLDAFRVFDELINGDLISYPTLYKNATGLDSYFNYLDTPTEKGFRFSYDDYITSKEMRLALHVGSVPYGTDDSNVEKHLMSDIMQSVAPFIAELLSNYRVLIYNGQLDVIVAYPLTVHYLQKLDFTGAEEYKAALRSKWHVNGALAGYIKKAGNLTEVMVRNAGHMVPKDQPEWALDLISKFIRNQL